MSISPNVPSPEESYHYGNLGTPRWITALFGLLVAGVAALGYAGYSVQTRLQQELARSDEQSKILSAQLEQANTRIAELKGQVDVTAQKVGMTQAELADAKSRAEAIRKQQAASDQKLSEEISAAQKDSDAKIGAVATDVTGAKKDIESTRSDLEELKRKGDRNYYEFTIQKSKAAQRVGPVQMKLDKTDQKKSRYTMTVLADDKSIEKKDKTAGEPVQFYVKGSARSAPFEIVVFDVGKNQITGYLATPKDTSAPASK